MQIPPKESKCLITIILFNNSPEWKFHILIYPSEQEPINLIKSSSLLIIRLLENKLSFLFLLGSLKSVSI